MPIEFLHPQYDVIPDPSDDRYLFCPRCDFFIGKDRPNEFQSHLDGHGVSINSIDAVPVNEVAGPLTEDIRPLEKPRAYTCSLCHQKIEGYAQFMAHRRKHKQSGVEEDV